MHAIHIIHAWENSLMYIKIGRMNFISPLIFLISILLSNTAEGNYSTPHDSCIKVYVYLQFYVDTGDVMSPLV